MNRALNGTLDHSLCVEIKAAQSLTVCRLLWTECVPQHYYVEVLIPSVTVQLTPEQRRS